MVGIDDLITKGLRRKGLADSFHFVIAVGIDDLITKGLRQGVFTEKG